MFIPEIMARFWARVNTQEETACWPWLGNCLPSGYGRFRPWHGAKDTYAHRLAYESAYGAIPKGLQIMHLCHNKACCNPVHLHAGTDSDNKMHESVSDKLRSDNATGTKGVGWIPARHVWRARGTVDQTEINLYWGPSFEEAVQARRAWEATVLQRLSTSING